MEEELRSLTESVNWLGGCQTAFNGGALNSSHRRFFKRARACVEERCEEERDFCESTHEAVSALLRARAGYSDEVGAGVGGLTSYKPGTVSLPADSSDAPELRSLVSGKASVFLDDLSSMLDNSDVSGAAGQSDPRLYMDPVLGRGGAAYNGFVKDLWRRGLVRFTVKPMGHVTVFFVFKKSGQLRMIVDARVVNKRFKRAPTVNMTTPEVLSSLECAPDDVVFSSTIDVKDCFHRLKLSCQMSDYFCMPGGTAKQFGVTHVNGEPVDPSTYIWPACQCLPMGFSWSVYFAQNVAVEMVARAEVMLPADELKYGHSDVE